MGKYMKHQGSRFYRIVAGVINVLLFSITSAVVLAQEEEAEFVNFRIQTVKLDKVAQWESLRKERSEALQEAGVPFHHVWQRQRGPLATYVVVTPAGTIGEPGRAFGEQPQVPVSENWVRALQSTLDSQSLVTLRSYPGLSTLSEPGHPSGNFAHTRIRTVAMGRNADYEAWLRDDLIPGLREAGAGDVRAARVVLGGSPSTWVTWSFVQGWPEPALDLDTKMIAKANDMVSTQVDYFYRLMEDLSFTAE
jgi:hypothetical protein